MKYLLRNISFKRSKIWAKYRTILMIWYTIGARWGCYTSGIATGCPLTFWLSFTGRNKP